MKPINIKSKLLTLVLLAGTSVFAAPAIGVGIELGAPPPPPHVRVIRPPMPAPGYVWVNGFYEPVAGQYRWREGYWASRPYPHAIWVAPRYSGHRYYGGYWRR